MRIPKESRRSAAFSNPKQTDQEQVLQKSLRNAGKFPVCLIEIRWFTLQPSNTSQPGADGVPDFGDRPDDAGPDSGRRPAAVGKQVATRLDQPVICCGTQRVSRRSDFQVVDEPGDVEGIGDIDKHASDHRHHDERAVGRAEFTGDGIHVGNRIGSGTVPETAVA